MGLVPRLSYLTTVALLALKSTVAATASEATITLTDALNLEQIVLQKPVAMDTASWKVSLSSEWDVLGPFPIHAREQHFLSPSFPLNVSEVVDLNATYPSAYADGGSVGWSKAKSREDGTLAVSFPNIRWEALRATEGWAALQHHTVLRSTITLHPPAARKTNDTPPRLLVNLEQGSFFTVVPEGPGKPQDDAVVPEWHAGNIYAMGRSPANVVSLPVAPSTTEPTTYSIFDLTPSTALSQYMDLELVRETRLAPGQTRIVPIRFTQKQPIDIKHLEFTLTVISGNATSTVDVALPAQNRAQWNASNGAPSGIKASYLGFGAMPAAFLVTPPEHPNVGSPKPPILALHGAGVDIFEFDFWVQALPRQRHSWIVLPAGRTAWGMDWHGPSAQEAWGTVDALQRILARREQWHSWGIAPNTKVLLMGHSNGGQGAWYLAGRYPDRVVGVVPAAGYIKSQAYVPLVQSRSAHYVDPAVRAILDSSLTPDDNDLFLSNLVDTPVLAIHGGEDDNVPVWHTREAVSVLKTWNPQASVTFREDPGELHWYPSVFANEQVQNFLSSTLEESSGHAKISSSFTLTVATPSDSGSLHGWSILRLGIPGRLGRLTVEASQDAIRVRTRNVQAFSIHIGSLPDNARNVPFIFDGQQLDLDEETWNLKGFTLSLSREDGQWTPHSQGGIRALPPMGRVANILNTKGPITIVIPSKQTSRELSAASRLAHNLNVYHKLDAEIVDDQEAAAKFNDLSQTGNIILLGLGEFAKSTLRQRRTAFSVVDDVLSLRSRLINESGTAALILHPHPTHDDSLLLLMHGTDAVGLERALRLFPIRTGITVPDWVIVTREADERGTAGVEGAGVWGNDWSWNEAMSAF
ncbi:hypothetical protein ONZ51_g11162 [Trametes cubensis]|uniref:Peptidase S9 prolyl oligopeptidase catalytic domain-containing protein n=1 Tax=Trametes cubensis TaxID=1111947 RepID=A0AAD7TKP4_9APHY|nr:hypothetical protein ONZ51_g11162 [Trametes cubensis]